VRVAPVKVPVGDLGAATELALRSYRERRAAQRGERLGRPPFKCGPEENRRPWKAVAADVAPPCG
jgi:hypothetical protein